MPISEDFPGLYRPGLIEAGSITAFIIGVDIIFRGFIAPASLKRPRASGSWAPTDNFPGLYRPGLIEAKARPDP